MTIEEELVAQLTNEGYKVESILPLAVSREGVEYRGVVSNTIELVKNLYVFIGDEVDPDTARAIARSVFAWADTRGRDADDVDFVTIVGKDGKPLATVARERKNPLLP